MNLKSTLCILLLFETRRKWIRKWLLKQSLWLLSIKLEIVGISYSFLLFFSAYKDEKQWKSLDLRTHTFSFIDSFAIRNAERRGFWDKEVLQKDYRIEAEIFSDHEFPKKKIHNIFFQKLHCELWTSTFWHFFQANDINLNSFSIKL